MGAYLCKHRIGHDGELYEPGAPIELTDAQAEPLLALGAIEAAAEAPAMPVENSGVEKESDDPQGTRTAAEAQDSLDKQAAPVEAAPAPKAAPAKAPGK